jgi:hypothetical protein
VPKKAAAETGRVRNPQRQRSATAPALHTRKRLFLPTNKKAPGLLAEGFFKRTG